MEPARVETLHELGTLLRQLKRRHARRTGDSELTYRELAAKTGWSFSVIGEYFGGKTLPPTDRFDDLIRLLGAEGPELAELATARDRVEERRRDVRPAVVSGQSVPRQLPAMVPHFTGRIQELSDVVPAIACVNGPPGVGKTSFAVAWAHRVADRFPDGQLYVNLRGFDPHAPAMSPAEALHGFLEALDVSRMPHTLQGQIGLYRSLCAGRRLLVLLDNARDAEQVRPLLPGAPGCAVVVTSRNQLTGLVAAEGAHPVTLGPLGAADARRLLRRRLGRTADVHADAVDEIVARCGGLPLALVIAAAQAATNPGLTLGRLAVHLRRLDGLAGDDPATDVRAVFTSSYRALTRAAARSFRLLGLHPGPEISTAAAAALVGDGFDGDGFDGDGLDGDGLDGDGLDGDGLDGDGLDGDGLDGDGLVGHGLDGDGLDLAALVRASLLTERAPGRYVMHDLVRLYAGELAGEDRAATERLLDHYLGIAYACDRALNTHRLPIDVTAPVHRADAAVADPLAWFDAERAVLLVLVGHAAAHGFARHAWQLAWSLSTYLDRRGHWHEWAAAQETALRATATAEDGTDGLVGRIQAHRGLAAVHTRLGNHDTAHTHYSHLLGLGDAGVRAEAHRGMGVSLERQGLPAQALEHARQAFALYEAAGDRAGQATVQNELGWYHALTGDFAEAAAHAERALARHAELGNAYGEAGAWDTLGYAHHHLGDHARAVECHERSLELVRRLGSRYYEADVLRHLADAQAAAGDPAAAQDSLKRALSILEEIGHPDADTVRAAAQASGSDGRRQDRTG